MDSATSAPDDPYAKIWAGDLLGRRDDAERIVHFIMTEIKERRETDRVPSYVLNLDARWGQGKTFFLKRFQEHLEHDGHKVAVLNAWEDDHCDDPLIALVSALDKVFGANAKLESAVRTAWEKVRSGAGTLVIRGGQHALQHATGKIFGQDGAADLGDGIKGFFENGSKDVIKDTAEKLIKAFEEKKTAAKTFREQAGSLATEKSLLFVLVDELDRCRPTYAILLLERIKHLFETGNVIFIVATDTEQLGCAIKAVYGQDFDSRLYLKRFFSRTYVFPDPSLESFIETYFAKTSTEFANKLSSPLDVAHAAFIASWAKEADLSLRDLEQCMDLLKSMATLWDKAVPIELVYAFPLIIVHHRGDRECFRRLANLEDPNPSGWRALAPSDEAIEKVRSINPYPIEAPIRGPVHLLRIYRWLARRNLSSNLQWSELPPEIVWIENRFLAEAYKVQRRQSSSESRNTVALEYHKYIEGAALLRD